MMKRWISVLLAFTMIFTFHIIVPASAENAGAESLTLDYTGMNDTSLLPYIEDTLYDELVQTLNSDEYFVESVQAIYISQEYLDELAFNSQANIYFGYTLDELDAQFQGEKFIFTLGENNETIVEPFENYQDPYEQVIRNVAIGSGVILVCATVSVVSAGTGAVAVSVIFATAAESGTIAALTGAALGGVAAGVVKGVQTGDMSQALDAAALGASEGFKWGAISGALSGGTGKYIELKGMTLNGLTLEEAAIIQKESGYPIDVIKQFKSMNQYEICKKAGLRSEMVGNKNALIRNIDLNYVDELGRTNLERMQQGLAALDPDGIPYELHHIGQKMDSTLAILTKAEHMQNGNDLIWHEVTAASKINRTAFGSERSAFWKTIAAMMGGA